ncbi:CorA metal ion transporter [Rhizina undulata]
MESEHDDRKMDSSKDNLNGGGGIHGPWAQSPIGRRPTLWSDIFSPTDAEMKVLSKAFGIHPLTTEDNMMQEIGEKVELFRSLYLKDYITVSADWISYELIDDITDALAPLIEDLEELVDDIDDAILRMHVAVGSAQG